MLSFARVAVAKGADLVFRANGKWWLVSWLGGCDACFIHPPALQYRYYKNQKCKVKSASKRGYPVRKNKIGSSFAFSFPHKYAIFVFLKFLSRYLSPIRGAPQNTGEMCSKMCPSTHTKYTPRFRVRYLLRGTSRLILFCLPS